MKPSARGKVRTKPWIDVALPIFGVIGGLVTEKGGALSHPGTLAREYGLPAVLSASGATETLRDGMRVRLDGAAGTVEILA